MISDMRRRNAHAGLVVFWVKLWQKGYTRSIGGLYRVLRKQGQMAVKPPNPKYVPKPYELCVCRRNRPGYKKGHAHKIFPNLLNRNFMADKANHVWCTDFTYVFLTNGFMRYNCTIIDLYDRSVIASETGKWITSDLAIMTLEKALHSQKKEPKNLILHSDQGSQFTSIQFISYCQKHSITQSMSAAGCPYDNAPMERYYNTFKAELINRFNF
jgi:putative transposase